MFPSTFSIKLVTVAMIPFGLRNKQRNFCIIVGSFPVLNDCIVILNSFEN
jgi:hypothetical protein